MIDAVIDEPVGGAHRNHNAVFEAAEATIANALSEMSGVDGPELRRQRQEKFLAIGRNLA